MSLIPTQEEVLDLLRSTGGLREGHFEYPNGLHTSEYLQVALTMRYHDSSNFLSVALSRLVRSNPEIRAILSELSIVTPATGGLPVAYGISEALRARQVYWAEREHCDEPLHFRQFLEIREGEKVLLVDDILRTGSKLMEVRSLVEARGGEVVGVAVIVHQPFPGAASFDPLPFYSLVHLDPVSYKDAAHCGLCVEGVPLIKTVV